MMARRKNIWPFSSRATAPRNTIPASGGIASRIHRKAAAGKSTPYKGFSITPTAEGFRAVDSEFDTLRDAKRFIDAWAKRNPKAKVTDRAHRYRANRNAPAGPKICGYCGAKRGLIEVEHINGKEQDSAPENLIWACRSCNVTKANVMRKRGMGRLTHQYNPAGATTLAQWLTAVSVITPHQDRGQGALFPSADNRMSVAAAVAMIRATSPARRSEFASEIRSRKSARARYNPADASAKAFEDFHGKPSNETVTVSRRVHFHKHLAAAGKLRMLKVEAVDGKHLVTIRFTKGTVLAFNEERNQLFVEGGDQAVNLKDFGIAAPHELETLGKVIEIDYFTSKDHLGAEGGAAIYRHKFRTTNQGGRHVTIRVARCPDLIYQVRDQQMTFSGGSYEIIPEGIDR